MNLAKDFPCHVRPLRSVLAAQAATPIIVSDDLSFDGVSEDFMKIRLGLQAKGKNLRRQHAFIGISGLNRT